MVKLEQDNGLQLDLIDGASQGGDESCVPDILVNRKYPGKAEKLAALKDAFRWFEANGTLPVFPSIPQNLSDVVPAVAEERCDEEEREMEE
jgi:hypothetical protein